jgi:hypothetical protein
MRLCPVQGRPQCHSGNTDSAAGGGVVDASASVQTMVANPEGKDHEEIMRKS